MLTSFAQYVIILQILYLIYRKIELQWNTLVENLFFQTEPIVYHLLFMVCNECFDVIPCTNDYRPLRVID